MDGEKSYQIKEQKIEMKQMKEKIGLPPKIPKMLVTKPDVKQSESMDSKGILPISNKSKSSETEKLTAPPSPSKGEGVVIGSSSKSEVGGKGKGKMTHESNVDSKRERRILANRLSAQRSRLRKMHYVDGLEKSAEAFEAEIMLLRPQLTFYDSQRRLLNVENTAILQRISTLMHEKVFKDAKFETMKQEAEKLKQLQQQQQQFKVGFEGEQHGQVQTMNIKADPTSFIYD